MRRRSRFEQEALSNWRAEQALYAQGDLTAGVREHLRRLMERTMETELTQGLGADRQGRSDTRSDWRNGYRERDLVTEVGLLRGLRVPRCRRGGYQPKVFGRYARRQPLVNALIVEMFVAGVATRRVGEVLEALLGECPSATTLSRIAKALDERVREFHSRPLSHRWRFLLLDGVAMSVKGASGLRKRLVLVVHALDGQGRRELWDFTLADGESEAEWAALLHHLWGRGLKGAKLELVVSDGAPGLIAALKFSYPHALHQRCWVHKLRNVANQVRKRDQQQVIAGARAIYQASTRRAAFLAWKRQWQARYPKAVLCLEKDLNELLACMDSPNRYGSSCAPPMLSKDASSRCAVAPDPCPPSAMTPVASASPMHSSPICTLSGAVDPYLNLHTIPDTTSKQRVREGANLISDAGQSSNSVPKHTWVADMSHGYIRSPVRDSRSRRSSDLSLFRG